MRPLSIADYLDRLGSSAEEKAPPRPEGSPFRPRSLPSPQTAASGAKPVFDRLANKGGETQGEEAPRRTPWAPKPVSLKSAARGSAPTGEPAKPEDMSAQARRRLRPRPRAGPFGRPHRGGGPPRGRARRSAGVGGNAAARVSSQGIGGARRRDPVRNQRDRGQCRRRRHPYSRAVSLAAGRQTGGGGVGQGDCPDLCEHFARVGQDSRTRARACAPAPANRRSADRGRICRGSTERKPSSRPTPRGLSPSFARGPSCWPRSRPERSR